MVALRFLLTEQLHFDELQQAQKTNVLSTRRLFGLCGNFCYIRSGIWLGDCQTNKLFSTETRTCNLRKKGVKRRKRSWRFEALHTLSFISFVPKCNTGGSPMLIPEFHPNPATNEPLKFKRDIHNFFTCSCQFF